MTLLSQYELSFFSYGQQWNAQDLKVDEMADKYSASPDGRHLRKIQQHVKMFIRNVRWENL